MEVEDYEKKRSLDLNAVVPVSKHRRIDEYPHREDLLSFFTPNSSDFDFSRDLFSFLQRKSVGECNHPKDPPCPWSLCRSCCKWLRAFVSSKYKPSKVCICTYHDENSRGSPIFLEFSAPLNENQFSLFFTSIIETNLVVVAPPQPLQLSIEKYGLSCRVQLDKNILKYKSHRNDFWYYVFRFSPLPFLLEKIRVETDFFKISFPETIEKGRYFGFLFKNVEQDALIEAPEPSPRLVEAKTPPPPPPPPSSSSTQNRTNFSLDSFDPHPYFTQQLQKYPFEQSRQLLQYYWNPSSFAMITLLCPLSKTTIQRPIRGKKCSHLQAFDLENFLKPYKDSHKKIKPTIPYHKLFSQLESFLKNCFDFVPERKNTGISTWELVYLFEANCSPGLEVGMFGGVLGTIARDKYGYQQSRALWPFILKRNVQLKLMSFSCPVCKVLQSFPDEFYCCEFYEKLLKDSSSKFSPDSPQRVKVFYDGGYELIDPIVQPEKPPLKAIEETPKKGIWDLERDEMKKEKSDLEEEKKNLENERKMFEKEKEEWMQERSRMLVSEKEMKNHSELGKQSQNKVEEYARKILILERQKKDLEAMIEHDQKEIQEKNARIEALEHENHEYQVELSDLLLEISKLKSYCIPKQAMPVSTPLPTPTIEKISEPFAE